MKLLIDTRKNDAISAKLIDGETSFEEVSKAETKRPESILLLIENVCKKAKIRVHDIDEIEVEEGPGSYTGIKVGVSVANALSFSLQKKINGKPLGELIEPKYE